MRSATLTQTSTASERPIDLSELCPDSIGTSAPALDQRDTLEMYRAYEDGVLTEAPQALVAYVSHQQHATY